MHDPRLSRLLAAFAAIGLVAACGGASDIKSSDDESSTSTPPAVTTPTSPAETSPPTSTSPDDLPAGFGAGPAGKGLDRFYDQPVSWTGCGGGHECADIWVPLDYADPDGEAITLKAEREAAGDPANRIGSLLINPGGPGASGIDYLSYGNFDPSLTNVYDLVGFDPRGVATSTPIDCLSDDQLDTYVASDPTPDNDAEVRQFQALWSTFTSGCEQRSDELLGHVSTVEAARDMDIIRAVVGDDKLNYFGASYGTYLGTTYAAIFPDNVGRMVLDGAIDPLASPRQAAIDQAAGFDSALTGYLQYCVDQGDCPLGTSVDAARQRLIALFDDIDAHPLTTTSGRELTEGLAFLGVIVPLYQRDAWDYETQALQAAVNGDGSSLLVLADAYTERTPDGEYPNNSMEVQPAVNCLDHPEHESISEIEQGRSDFVSKAPVFGQAATWWPYACSNWPVKSAEPHPDYTAKGAAPILVVGTTRDPATPYQGAVRLSHLLDSGVLLTRDGDGHTAYKSGNQCIDDAIDGYLAKGVVPKDGTDC